ncbi:MAG: hypothetical protein AAF198_05215 [Pseudomonadota bacterium]
MKTLLIDHLHPRLGLWARHLERHGMTVVTAASADEAFRALATGQFEAMVLNMGLPDGSAMPIADYAIFKNPDIKIIGVSSDQFFSNGTLFSYIPNLCSQLGDSVPPEDLGATVAFYAGH